MAEEMCTNNIRVISIFFFQAEDGIRDRNVTGVQTCALPILKIPAGKYLVNDEGKITYFVDPAINGKLDKWDDGRSVKSNKYSAPKTQLMAKIIDGIFNQKLPWSLVLLGVLIALTLELTGVPSLPFAVGVYLPLESSTPIFLGGMVRLLVERVGKWRGKSVSESEAEMSPGSL